MLIQNFSSNGVGTSTGSATDFPELSKVLKLQNSKVLL